MTATDPPPEAANLAGIASGDVLGARYRIDALVASGGMAEVFRATDERLGRPVAIKAFRVGEAADRRRFANEVATQAALQHPHLVAVLDAVNHGDRPFIVLELHPSTLSERLAGTALPTEDVAALGAGVAGALAHIHDRRIVHRDVKPANILLASDGRAILGDFGIARVLDATRITSPAITVGTLAYLAPEQLAGEPVGPAADVHSLGLVLIEALTGRPVFRGTQAELLAQRSRPVTEIPGSVPQSWRGLLAAMTNRDPRRRPAAAAVAASLESLRHADQRIPTTEIDAGGPAMLPAAARRAGPPPTRGWIVAAAVLAALVLAGLLLARNDGTDPLVTPEAVTTTSAAATATTAAPAAAPVPTAEPVAQVAATCAELEAQREGIERQKQEVEAQYRDDQETRERLKEELEAQKAAIDEQRQALGCGG